jgi:hypothetical protein
MRCPRRSALPHTEQDILHEIFRTVGPHEWGREAEESWRIPFDKQCKRLRIVRAHASEECHVRMLERVGVLRAIRH